MVFDVPLAYLGPETMLPLASFFAAIIGGLLMGWRYVLAAIRRVFAILTGRTKTDAPVTSSAASSPSETQE